MNPIINEKLNNLYETAGLFITTDDEDKQLSENDIKQCEKLHDELMTLWDKYHGYFDDEQISKN